MNMNMKETLRAGMLEATRLVRTGALRDATAKIQRALRGILSPDATADTSRPGTGTPIEGTFRVVDSVAPTGVATDEPRPDARPSTLFRAPLRPHPQRFREPTMRPAPTPDRASGVESGGRFISGSYTNHAGTRTYKLYIPSAYQGEPLPLIVMLHGCTQTPDDFAAGTRMNGHAEERHCFVLYPAQARGANQSNCWNWFNAADQHRDSGEPSIIAGITRHIIETYAVDTRRIYLAGLSAGGAMAGIMGLNYSDLYAAIGIHSGLPCAVAHDLPSAFAAMSQAVPAPDGKGHAEGFHRAVPTIVFHGDRDTKVHPRNGDHVIAQCLSVHARFASANEAATSPQVIVHRGQRPSGHAYTRTTYNDPSGRTILEQWQVHGAGHAWSGGSDNGSYTDPHGPDATNEMIRFFFAHRQPEKTDTFPAAARKGPREEPFVPQGPALAT